MNLRNKKRKGFTLIEMVVVVAIIVIIGAMTMPKALGAINKAKASSDIANGKTYAQEIMLKYTDGEVTESTLKLGGSVKSVLKDENIGNSKLQKGEFTFRYEEANGGHIKIFIKKDTLPSQSVEIYPSPKGEWETYVK